MEHRVWRKVNIYYRCEFSIFYLWSMALVFATEREAMALTASASSESPRLASSRESPSRGE